MTEQPRLDELNAELALIEMRDLADRIPVPDALDDIRRRTQ
ncbi:MULTISPECIES: hypothetical protein [Streptosporangium]|uniref:Uncharacterized protein n=1 Tax=Streptosporangium jomthongense TaxID=1193683 RepID=A0ABV8F8B9_9ACTN